jgi:hypothetical protein
MLLSMLADDWPQQQSHDTQPQNERGEDRKDAPGQGCPEPGCGIPATFEARLREGQEQGSSHILRDMAHSLRGEGAGEVLGILPRFGCRIHLRYLLLTDVILVFLFDTLSSTVDSILDGLSAKNSHHLRWMFPVRSMERNVFGPGFLPGDGASGTPTRLAAA